MLRPPRAPEDLHLSPAPGAPGLYFISAGASGAEQQFRQHSPPIRAHVCSPAAAYAQPHLSCSPHILMYSCCSPQIQFLGGLSAAGISDKGSFKAAPSIHCVLDFTHTSRNEAGGNAPAFGNSPGRGGKTSEFQVSALQRNPMGFPLPPSPSQP